MNEQNVKIEIHKVIVANNAMQKSNDLNRIIAILLIKLSSFGCQNYESQKYIDTENEAINDLILGMTKFEEMKRLNEWHNEKLTLYIISSLDTATAWTQKPEGYTIAISGVDLSNEEVEQNKRIMKWIWQDMNEKKNFLESLKMEQ